MFEVQAITHRHDPMFQDIVSGGMEHLLLSVPALEHRTLRDAKAASPGVRKVSLPAPLTSIISQSLTPGVIYPIGIITALIGVPVFVSIILSTRRRSLS